MTTSKNDYKAGLTKSQRRLFQKCFVIIFVFGGFVLFWVVNFFAPGFTPVQKVEAIPAFARKYDTNCTTCHVLPPKLNAFGESFLARGYRMPEGWKGRNPNSTESTESTESSTNSKLAKLGTAIAHSTSVWVSGRYENSATRFSKGYVNRVEIISAAPIGDSPFSYFVEWRPVSLETTGNGSLRDRSGRFEDAFVNADINERNSFTVGQYRSLKQVDVSRRLTITEPAFFSTSVAATERSSNNRLQSLRAFAPSGRSPGFTYQFKPLLGKRPSDGLFFLVTVPFAGELSIPLTSGARREASFQLEGRPKGVFVESFYRKRLNSIGGHAFFGNDRQLVQGVGTLNYKRFYATGGIGMDRRNLVTRGRYSIEGEYLTTNYDRFRSMLGFRVEQITNANRRPAFIPYFVISGPNTKNTFSLAVQYRSQRNNDALFGELSFMF